MARRLNFTDRKKIRRQDAKIRIVERNGHYEFDAEISLGDYDVDPTALVHVEAFRSVSTLWKRFDFGRVGDLGPREKCSLEEFGRPDGIRFRAKVASSGEALGRLLAEADNIRPLLPGEVDENRDPILNVAPAALGAEAWKVEFGDGSLPELQINETLQDWAVIARNPVFRSLVLPAAMRQVLIRILFHEGDWDDDDEDDWRTRWIRFAQELPGVGDCPGVPDDEDQDAPFFREVEEWVDQAVNAFSQRAGLLSQLVQCRESGVTL